MLATGQGDGKGTKTRSFTSAVVFHGRCENANRGEVEARKLQPRPVEVGVLLQAMSTKHLHHRCPGIRYPGFTSAVGPQIQQTIAKAAWVCWCWQRTTSPCP